MARLGSRMAVAKWYRFAIVREVHEENTNGIELASNSLFFTRIGARGEMEKLPGNQAYSIRRVKIILQGD